MDILATLKTLMVWMLQFSATCLIVWSYPYWSMVLIYEALERFHMKFWKMAFGLPPIANAATMACLVSWGNSPPCKELYKRVRYSARLAGSGGLLGGAYIKVSTQLHWRDIRPV